MKVTGIYKIVNPKGLVYIGQSTNITRRINQYKGLYCKDQSLLYNSFKKYGFDNHIIEILQECTIEELNKLERKFIEQFKSNDRKFGLNLTTGGQDYWFHTEETRKKMSLAQQGNQKALGRKQSKEEIDKRISKLKGQTRTQEQRNRMSQAHKGRKASKETRKKMSKSFQYKNAKRVINVETQEVFNRVADAAESIGMKRGTLTAHLSGQTKINKTPFKYLE